MTAVINRLKDVVGIKDSSNARINPSTEETLLSIRDVSGIKQIAEPVTIQDGGNSITVDSSDLDIRDLSYTSDSVSAYKAGTWNNLGINIDNDNVGIAKEHTTQTSYHSVRVTDGSSFIDPRDRTWTITETVRISGSVSSQQLPASLTASGNLKISIEEDNSPAKDVNVQNTVTVTSTDLDIRDLSYSTDSITAYKGGTWSNIGVNIDADKVGLSKEHATATSFHSARITDGSNFIDPRDRNWTITETVTVTGSVSIQEPLSIDDNNSSITIDTAQLPSNLTAGGNLKVSLEEDNAGTKDVNVTNTVTVSATDFDIRDLNYGNDSVTAYKGGTWSGIGVNLDADNIGLAKEHTSASSYHSTRITDGTSFIDPRDRNWTISETVNVSATDLDIRNLNYTQDSIYAVQSGSWTVNTSTAEYTTLMDYSGQSLEYVGFADPGTSTSSASWLIMKLFYDANGNMTAKKYANGTATFDKVWDNRTSYSYS